MSVNIHGKEYRTVAERINLFYSTYKDKITAITTEIIKDEKNIVQVKATISAKDKIENPTFFVFGNGFAEEDRTKGRINSTSALENCETSAIGRALASIGLGGEEYASANEVQNAIHQQNEPKSKTITKDDGSQFPQQQPKRNTDLTKLLQDQVEEAKKLMSNGNGESEVSEEEFKLDAICNFKKHKGKMWSEVADEDREYIGWVLNNIKDLDVNTKTVLKQFA
tara:strand:+ start:394 stop:1065 length:672 start_codon:yes stop_codon:yes gene_type:complete